MFWIFGIYNRFMSKHVNLVCMSKMYVNIDREKVVNVYLCCVVETQSAIQFTHFLNFGKEHMRQMMARFPKQDNAVTKMKNGLVKISSASGVAFFSANNVVELIDLVKRETFSSCSDSYWSGDIQLISVVATVSSPRSTTISPSSSLRSPVPKKEDELFWDGVPRE